MKLTKNELLKITGGGVSWTAVGIIGGILTIIAGIFDGYQRPIKCNK